MISFLKKLVLAVLLVFGLCGLWVLLSFSAEKPEPDHSYQKYFNEHYRIFSLNVPTQMEFAGESVPLHILDVREKLDRELLINTYWQSQSLLFYKRANRWFPVIESILQSQGVPDDFKYLALIESGLTNAVSPAGATGFWQILKETGREYGLEINDEVDERYHVEKSTLAACKYLKEAYRKYGNWTTAAASYNMGMNGLARQTTRQQANNYYDLLLNEETGRYVYRILAVKELISKPAQYGFHFRPQDLYPAYRVRSLKVDTAVTDLAIFSIEKGYNYKILKILNPWLRESFLTNPTNKSYVFHLPLDTAQGLIPYELEVKQLPPLDTLSQGSILVE